LIHKKWKPSVIEFFCNLSQSGTPLPHFWEHTVGSDHALVALRADCQAQLRRCHQERGFKHLRFHGLLSDDVGTFISVGSTSLC
jgi:xylan 1,4-beta-xylosidase